ITQQTVKTLVLGPERSYTRKMREAILARELEQMLTKDGILHLYLNQIYFGSGAYGVEEASQTYFGKSVRELDLGEAAYLAAIPKNPSRYTIRANPAAAKERQAYVLNQMVANGWAEEKEAKKEIEAPIPSMPTNRPYLRKTPHYTEHVRRLLIEKYGEKRTYDGGLTVYTGMNAAAQVAAQDALRRGLEDLGRRHGYPGAPVRIEVDKLDRYTKILHEAFDTKVEHLAEVGDTKRRVWDLTRLTEQVLDEKSAVDSLRTKKLTEGIRVTAIVANVDSVTDMVWLDLGSCRGKMTLRSLKWARRFSPEEHTPPPRDPADVLHKGDLVQVDLSDVPVRLAADQSALTVKATLVPEPKAEGALVSIDPHTRYVRALVGGYRQEAGGLIRAVQSRRQPGSAFKPIVYAAGLDEGVITPASTCPDAAVVIRDPWTGKAWKPQNYEDGRYDGNITYRTALKKSKNTCSVKLIQKIGPEKVITLARAMGIDSTLPENLTLALGSGEVSPLELANAYATIASGGFKANPIFIRKVVDKDGRIVEETHAEPVEVLRPAVAYVLSHMMTSVIEDGTARRAKVLDRTLAGKTGTSNESRDVWFGGFSPELVGVVWVGFDDNAPLGRATGSSTALPIWIRYMDRALEGVPQRDFPPPEGVVFVKVDPETGLASHRANAIEEAFIEGSEPTEETQPLRSIFIEDEDDGSRLAAGSRVP
ncbi:MAG: PBP1A family penicillin-binding protein, partial [Myxococcota bacterium]